MKNIDIYQMLTGVSALMKKQPAGRILYSRVYKKTVEYIDEKHHGGKTSGLVKTKEGWSCVIEKDGKNTVLYITEKEGQVSFWEKDI